MPEAASPMSDLDPVLIASRWVCGDLLPENIPQIAIELIEASHEEPSVFRLAAEDNISNRDQVEALVQRMFRALKVPYPISQSLARQNVARQIAREVAAGLKDPWSAAAQLDRAVPHWETKDENIWAIYGITDQADWDPGFGSGSATLESELIEAFGRLALSQP